MSQVDIPASPAQLAEVADQSFQAAKTKATELWQKTKVDELKEFVRDNASSVGAIQTLILLIEAVGLQLKTLDTVPTTEWTKSVPVLNSYNTALPNMWKLLTSDWWAPATLWSLTSWVLPLIFSYFFNLTLRSNTRHKSSSRQYTVDPLTFNIVKAILAYSAYCVSTTADAEMAGIPDATFAQKLGWGPFSEGTVSAVRTNVPGGYYGLQIGAVVGVLISLYDAALKK